MLSGSGFYTMFPICPIYTRKLYPILNAFQFSSVLQKLTLFRGSSSYWPYLAPFIYETYILGEVNAICQMKKELERWAAKNNFSAELIICKCVLSFSVRMSCVRSVWIV
jgi:hypothetical protein